MRTHQIRSYTLGLSMSSNYTAVWQHKSLLLMQLLQLSSPAAGVADQTAIATVVYLNVGTGLLLRCGLASM